MGTTHALYNCLTLITLYHNFARNMQSISPVMQSLLPLTEARCAFLQKRVIMSQLLNFIWIVVVFVSLPRKSNFTLLSLRESRP